jgi:hypothetical protein
MLCNVLSSAAEIEWNLFLLSKYSREVARPSDKIAMAQ